MATILTTYRRITGPGGSDTVAILEENLKFHLDNELEF